MTTNQKELVSDEELDQMIWKLERDGMTPKQLSLMRELREVRRAKAPTAPDEQSFWDWLRDKMPTTYRWSQELEDTPVNSALITKGKASALDMLSAWKGCSAAMQLSGNSEQLEPVSNRDELMLDYLQGHKDGLEWAAQLAEANHPQTGDWLYDDPIALAAAIRKGPDMPELKLVSADEDDNFYSWFGRFWSENYQQNNYTTSAKQMLGTMAEFAFRAGRESATQAGNSPATPDGWIPVSERMPDPKSELRVCVYTPNPHEDIRYRFVPASLFKAVCRDATHWHYMSAPKEVG